jgi:hypothetical protein
MDTASKILIVGGTLNIALSFVIGFVWSRIRLHPKPGVDPKGPELPHRMALWEGFMLLGLTWAVQLSDLPAIWETVAASMVVASSVFQDASVITNWRTGVQDQFAAKNIGFRFATINAILAAGGVLILTVGVLTGL